MVCIQRQNIITRPKQRGIYIKKQNHCNMAKQHGMHQSANTILHAKVVVLIQQQRNHRVSIKL